MAEKRQYNGLDVIKFILAILVAFRHVVQIYYPVESKWRLLICSWLSNLAVPGFFIMAGFFLFRKIENGRTDRDKKIVWGYCWRIFKLTLIWSAIYLPVDIYGWYYSDSDASMLEWIWYYIKSFFLSHTIVQLWFLPALIVACLLVWFLYSKKMKIWQILVAGGVLFGIYCFESNHYFGLQLPGMAILQLYYKYFYTMRNGLFYGTFYVALGLWFAKTEKRMSFRTAALGFVGCLALMFLEVIHYHNLNCVFMAAPAAFFMISAAFAVKWKNRKLYPRLRGMSQWVYLSQYYFMFLFSLATQPYLVSWTKKEITIAVMGPMILFSAVMVWLSEKKGFGWLRKLI
ncbi:MAG: acyltransferase [Hungatella sp.]|nr:acyltransferase [Hungatella sp.]